ncbi:hypothetical protein M413DRAFT_31924 [Hebeloma cylindrosporum]|uniref:Uncharacterized protein n=1 Tax=Hebeloma cylindrosporum TaxID=76867 RepID=A0A0C3BXM1_HEBCY|nr:hypothetical protein M413DRAFT_31924 [Hebeloma cylindrosporum h7]
MELSANFGGSYPLGGNTVKQTVQNFINQNPVGNNHTLTVNWSPPSGEEEDLQGWRTSTTMDTLFARLSQAIDAGTRDELVLTLFNRISITVSNLFGEMNVSFNGKRRTPGEMAVINSNKINLGSAVNLSELVLEGSHLYFSERFSNVPYDRLTRLSVSSSARISVNDTLVLLHSCPLLRDATFGIVDTEAKCELYSQFDPLLASANFTCSLKQLTITSHVDVSRIVGSLKWRSRPIITLEILNNAMAGQDWRLCFAKVPMNTQLTMKGNFPDATIESIERMVPDVFFW